MLRFGAVAENSWTNQARCKLGAALWGSACWWILASCLQAAPAGPSPGLPANRYLFVVETSKAMQRRGDPTVEVVRELVAGGMRGQMRSGDNVGLWTFNEELRTGEFPLQRWTPETANEIGAKTAGFLEELVWEKRAALPDALFAINGLVKQSEFITVILLTTGQERIVGTPFDDAINKSFSTWRSQQQKAQMPFVTILRGRKGVFTDFAVTPVPWVIEVPPLPVELTATPAAKSPAATRTSSVAPLVVTGRKPNAGQEAPAAAASKPAAPVTASAPTNVPAATAPTVVAGTGPSQPNENKPDSARPPVQPSAAVTSPPVAAGSRPSVSEGPTSTRSNLPVAALPAPPTSTTAAAASPVVVVADARAAIKPPSLPVATNTPPGPARVETRPAPLQGQGAANPLALTNSVQTSDAQTAITQPVPFLQRKTTRLVAVVAAGVAFGGLLLLLLKRPRPAPRGSVITRSLNRDQ